VGRSRRIYEEGCVYHLTAHGVDGQLLFLDDLDRQDFLIRLRRVVRLHLWTLHAFCLMDTHFHLLVGDGRIADGMRLLNGGYSRAFNARHGRRGALFEARYRDRQIRDEQHLLEAIRYIEENPIAAGLAEEWPWRSRTGV
jgi:putative transposase